MSEAAQVVVTMAGWGLPEIVATVVGMTVIGAVRYFFARRRG